MHSNKRKRDTKYNGAFEGVNFGNGCTSKTKFVTYLTEKKMHIMKEVE